MLTHRHPITSNPHKTSLGPTPLFDIISYCKIFAQDYANEKSLELYPQIITIHAYDSFFNEGWEISFNFATEGMTPPEIFGFQYNKD